MSVEAGSTLAWPRYADAHVGIDRFGLSGNGDAIMKEFGFTPENVVATAKKPAGGVSAQPVVSDEERVMR